MSRMPVLSAVAALLVSSGCATAPAVDTAAEEQAVRAISMHWLELDGAKDAVGIAALFADDGVMYREHEAPIVGTAAIQQHESKNFAEQPQARASWTTDRVYVAESGEVAVEYGSYSVAGLSDGDDSGRYTTVYRKIGGEWKVASDMSISTKPQPAADAAAEPAM